MSLQQPAPVSVAWPRVLVVEDDPLLQGLFAWVFRDLGTTLRADAREALGLCERPGPAFDAVVVDLPTRGSDGLALALALRRSPRAFHALLVGVAGDPPDGDRGLFDLFLPKPFSARVLRREVNRLLGERALAMTASALGSLPRSR